MKQATKSITLPKTDAEAVALVVRVAVWLAVGWFGIVGILLLVPRSQPADLLGNVKVPMAVDAKLAAEGKDMFVVKFGCTSCHAVRQAKVNGQTTGPDLSGAVLGMVPVGQVNPMEKWFKDQKLADALKEPERAAELASKFLEAPPPYARTMVGQVKQLKVRAGGDRAWKESVAAITEFLKTPVAKEPEKPAEKPAQARPR